MFVWTAHWKGALLKFLAFRCPGFCLMRLTRTTSAFRTSGSRGAWWRSWTTAGQWPPPLSSPPYWHGIVKFNADILQTLLTTIGYGNLVGHFAHLYLYEVGFKVPVTATGWCVFRQIAKYKCWFLVACFAYSTLFSEVLFLSNQNFFQLHITRDDSVPLILITVADIGKFLSENIVWMYSMYTQAFLFNGFVNNLNLFGFRRKSGSGCARAAPRRLYCQWTRRGRGWGSNYKRYHLWFSFPIFVLVVGLRRLHLHSHFVDCGHFGRLHHHRRRAFGQLGELGIFRGILLWVFSFFHSSKRSFAVSFITMTTVILFFGKCYLQFIFYIVNVGVDFDLGWIWRYCAC